MPVMLRCVIRAWSVELSAGRKCGREREVFGVRVEDTGATSSVGLADECAPTGRTCRGSFRVEAGRHIARCYSCSSELVARALVVDAPRASEGHNESQSADELTVRAVHISESGQGDMRSRSGRCSGCESAVSASGSASASDRNCEGV